MASTYCLSILCPVHLTQSSSWFKKNSLNLSAQILLLVPDTSSSLSQTWMVTGGVLCGKCSGQPLLSPRQVWSWPQQWDWFQMLGAAWKINTGGFSLFFVGESLSFWNHFEKKNKKIINPFSIPFACPGRRVFAFSVLFHLSVSPSAIVPLQSLLYLLLLAVSFIEKGCIQEGPSIFSEQKRKKQHFIQLNQKGTSHL